MADPELVATIAIFLSAYIVFIVSRDLQEEKFFGFAAKALGAGVSLWLVLGGLGFSLVTLQSALSNSNEISIANTMFMVVIAPVLLVSAYLTIGFLSKVFEHFKSQVKKKHEMPNHNREEY